MEKLNRLKIEKNKIGEKIETKTFSLFALKSEKAIRFLESLPSFSSARFKKIGKNLISVLALGFFLNGSLKAQEEIKIPLGPKEVEEAIKKEKQKIEKIFEKTPAEKIEEMADSLVAFQRAKEFQIEYDKFIQSNFFGKDVSLDIEKTFDVLHQLGFSFFQLARIDTLKVLSFSSELFSGAVRYHPNEPSKINIYLSEKLKNKSATKIREVVVHELVHAISYRFLREGKEQPMPVYLNEEQKEAAIKLGLIDFNEGVTNFYSRLALSKMNYPLTPLNSSTENPLYSLNTYAAAFIREYLGDKKLLDYYNHLDVESFNALLTEFQEKLTSLNIPLKEKIKSFSDVIDFVGRSNLEEVVSKKLEEFSKKNIIISPDEFRNHFKKFFEENTHQE